jgi:opacity protein-like surface antigen
MKKIIFAAAAVFAFGLTNAQETRFGAKGAVNFSNFGGDSEDTDMKVGFAIGGFAEVKLSDKFAVQPELLYSILGAKEGDVSANLNYIVIPVMAKYFVADQFSLEAGPQLGILMSAKATDGDNSADIKDGFNTTDFGFNFGAGYDVTEDINIGLRYSLGLSNILKDSGDFKSNNTNIALSFGYKF